MECGVDALGFVFSKASPRVLSIAQAARLSPAVPPFVARVALFMDDNEIWVREVLAEVPVDLLQFHGTEQQQACAVHGKPYIKAISMMVSREAASNTEPYPDAAAYLLDSNAPGHPGGTGRSFDWSRMPVNARKPIIVAGGLTSDNVALAVRKLRPYGVDVSSGVESSPGIKDAMKISKFCAEVRRADHEHG